MSETFQQMLKRRNWTTPAKALESMYLTEMPPECTNPKRVPSQVTVYHGDTAWPCWRPDAVDLVRAKEVSWTKPAPAKPKGAAGK